MTSERPVLHTYNILILPITTKSVKKHKKYSTPVRAADFRIYIVMREVALTLSNFKSIFTKGPSLSFLMAKLLKWFSIQSFFFFYL
jgi:hypothetical protein